MQMKDLAKLFSNKLAQWPPIFPSKALPFHIKSLLKNTWGKKVSANDFHKRHFPNRFGVVTRPFQIGDPLKTLSRSHLLRFNLFVTKTDVSAGRKNVLVVFHRYKNMTFQSQKGSVNKGQLACGLCSILEFLHLKIGQNFKITPIDDENFLKGCLKIKKQLLNYEKIYFISDFIFSSESLEASATETKTLIQQFGLKNQTFFIIRDPLELPEFVSHKQTFEFQPWDTNKTSTENNSKRYGDERYKFNLKKQLDDFEAMVFQSKNRSKKINPMTELQDILEFIK